MALSITRHFDPAATGTGDGSSQANAYTTLSALLSAEEKDLVAADETMVVLLHDDADLGSSQQWLSSTWVTDGTRKIIFRSATVARRHVTSSNSSRTMRTYTGFFKLENVSLLNSGGGQAIQYIVSSGAAGFELENAISDKVFMGSLDSASTGNIIKLTNAVVSDIDLYTAFSNAAAMNIDLINSNIEGSVRWNDNAIVTGKNSIFLGADAFIDNGPHELHMTNCRFVENLPDTLDTDTDNQINVDVIGIFTDAANRDYTLVGNPTLLQAGIGPSLDSDIPDTDFEGDARSGAVTYIGIDQVSLPATNAFASTLGPATLVAAGNTTNTGTLTATLSPATLSAAGNTANSGNVLTTLGPATLSATGNSANYGSLAVTLAPATLAALGDVVNTGTLAVTLAPATLVATGNMKGLGTFSTVLAPATLACLLYTSPSPRD